MPITCNFNFHMKRSNQALLGFAVMYAQLGFFFCKILNKLESEVPHVYRSMALVIFLGEALISYPKLGN